MINLGFEITDPVSKIIWTLVLIFLVPLNAFIKTLVINIPLGIAGLILVLRGKHVNKYNPDKGEAPELIGYVLWIFCGIVFLTAVFFFVFHPDMMIT